MDPVSSFQQRRTPPTKSSNLKTMTVNARQSLLFKQNDRVHLIRALSWFCSVLYHIRVRCIGERNPPLTNLPIPQCARSIGLFAKHAQGGASFHMPRQRINQRRPYSQRHFYHGSPANIKEIVTILQGSLRFVRGFRKPWLIYFFLDLLTTGSLD